MRIESNRRLLSLAGAMILMAAGAQAAFAQPASSPEAAAADARLKQTQEDTQGALKSHDQAKIDHARAEERAAYEQDWLAHHRQPVTSAEATEHLAKAQDAVKEAERNHASAAELERLKVEERNAYEEKWQADHHHG